MLLDGLRKVGFYEVALHAYISAAKVYDPEVVVKDAIRDFLRFYSYDDDASQVQAAYMTYYRMQGKLKNMKRQPDKTVVVIDTYKSLEAIKTILNDRS